MDHEQKFAWQLTFPLGKSNEARESQTNFSVLPEAKVLAIHFTDTFPSVVVESNRRFQLNERKLSMLGSNFNQVVQGDPTCSGKQCPKDISKWFKNSLSSPEMIFKQFKK